MAVVSPLIPPSTPTIASEFVVQGYSFDQRSPLRWVVSHLLRHSLFIVFFFIGALGNGGLAFVIPYLTGIAFNEALKPTIDINMIGQIALVLIVSQFLRAFLQFIRNACAEFLGQAVERDTREELYASLLGKSMSFHSMQAVGDIMARATNDVHEMNLMLNPGINMVIGSIMFMIFPLFFSPQIAPELLFAPLGFTIAYFASIYFYTRELNQITDKVRESFGKLNADLAASLDGIETVKGASQEDQEVVNFETNATTYRNTFVEQSKIEARFIPLLLLGIFTSIAFAHSLWLLRDGRILIGDVVAYMGYMSMFGFPVFISQFGFSNLALGLAAARRVLALILIRTDLDENKTGYSGQMIGTVQFNEVSFRYPDAPPTLETLNFEVKAGQVIAIVGQTGAGKSTLAKLLNRTYDTTQGQVCIDGRDVRDWNLEALRSQISIIEQDIFLFSRTIAENIAFGRPNATQAEIEQAAQYAQAHDFIMGFADGYQTIIGERGVTLSGGQRQRIALARAFLTNPRILILDDSTSAIDSATEDQIQRAIYHATAGRTTFLITHRLSQIRWADQIIVLRKGKIAAIGKHEDLLQSSTAYRNIFASEGLKITS